MQQAIARPEIAKPNRERVFCMAVTQEDVYGPRAPTGAPRSTRRPLAATI